MALAAIGTSVAGFFGATMIGPIAASVIGGAIVGATIGGLTSLVTNGDIGKGILFGAIGGAVTGGLGSWMSGASTPAVSNSLTTSGGAVQSTVGGAARSSLMGPGGAAATTTATSEAGGLFSGLSDTAQGALVQGGISTVGGMISGSAEEDLAAERLGVEVSEAEKQRELQRELTAMNNASAERRSGSSQAGALANVAEQRRQFNVNLAEKEKERKKGSEALENIRTARRSALPEGVGGIETQRLVNA